MDSIDLPEDPASVPADSPDDAHSRVRAAHRRRRRWNDHPVFAIVGIFGVAPVVIGFLVLVLAMILSPLRCSFDLFPANGPAERSTVIGIDRRDGSTRWRFETEGKGELAVSNANGGWLAMRSRDGDLITLDARTGNRLWDVQLNDIAASRPVVDGATVVILTRDRVLHAFDVRTGHRRWTVKHAVGGRRARRRGLDLPSDFDLRDSFGVAAGHGLVVALGRADRRVHAYQLGTGHAQWTTAVPATTATIPVVSGGRVLLQDRRSILYALDLDSGVEQWAYVIASETLDKCRARLRALTSNTSSTTVMSTPPSTVSKLDRSCFERMFLGPSDPDELPPPVGAVVGSRQSLSRRDAATGVVRWEVPYGRSELPVTGDEVVVATRGHLRGIDLATGATRWLRTFDGSQSTPLATSGRIVVLSQ